MLLGSRTAQDAWTPQLSEAQGAGMGPALLPLSLAHFRANLTFQSNLGFDLLFSWFIKKSHIGANFGRPGSGRALGSRDHAVQAGNPENCRQW